MTLRIALFIAFLMAVSPAAAHEYEHGNISLYHPYAYQVTLKGENSNAYMTITNDGDADVLLKATTPVAASIDILNEDTKMDKLEIGSHSSTKFKMRGIHFRLNGVKKVIKPGARAPITLTFEKAGDIKAQLLFSKIGEVSLCDDGIHNKKINADKRN